MAPSVPMAPNTPTPRSVPRPWPGLIALSLLSACGTSSPSQSEPTDAPGSVDPTPTATATSPASATPEDPSPTGTEPPTATAAPSAVATPTKAATPTPTSTPTPSPTPTDKPSPYIYDPPPDPEPTLGTEELGPIITGALTQALSLPVSPLYDTYKSLMTTADRNGCPLRIDTSSVYLEEEYWQGECVAASGTDFSGIGYSYVQNNVPDGDGITYSGWYLYLSGAIEGTNGDRVEGSGLAYDIDGAGPGFRIYLRLLDGRFLVDELGEPIPGLDGSSLPSLTTTAVYVPALSGNLITLEGGIGGLEGPIDTISILGFEISDAAMGSSCPEEPTGVVSLRARDGNWYDVIFDGPTTEQPEVPPELCDGCGDTYFRGTWIGTTCADFSPLITWEGSPW